MMDEIIEEEDEIVPVWAVRSPLEQVSDGKHTNPVLLFCGEKQRGAGAS